MKITNKMHYVDLFIIPSQLYMFRAMFSPIIRSTWRYLQYLVVFPQVAASWCLEDDDGRKHRPKHVDLTCNNKLIYIVHLVGYFHSCITMHGFMNVNFNCQTLHKTKYSYSTSLFVLKYPARLWGRNNQNRPSKYAGTAAPDCLYLKL